jgi:large subunit ribosomal protein L5
MAIVARLHEQYKEKVIPSLQSELGQKNIHAIPKLQKIVISMGIGAAIGERKRLEEALESLTLLSGQKAELTKARKSVSGFKLREGMEIGCRVTLRGKRMYEFLDRLISIVLPRVRDFRGLNPKAFDGRGNYSLGLNELLVFPEINPDKVHYNQGMNITIVSTANTNDEGRMLLKGLGFPFKTE